MRAAAPYLLLVAIVLIFFWPVWLAGYTFPIGGGDLWGQLLPVWSYVARFVRRGILPLWSTQMMAGDPIIAEPQYGLLNPLNWWLFVVGTGSRWAILARGVLPLVLAGSGVYTYLRHSSLWHLRTSSALVGATAYMLSDPFITHLGHPQMNDAMAWLPWALLAIDTLVDQARLRLWPSLVFACVILTGHYQAALFTAVATGLYAAWRLAFAPLQRWPRLIGRIALVVTCAVALSLPSVLPGLERYPYTERAILQLEPWRGYQWPLAMAIDLVAPGFHGRGIGGFWAPWARVEGGYIGAAALFLSLLGLLAGARHRRTWFLAMLGTLSVLFALGYDGPLYPLLARFDLVARMGKTARAIFLLAFVLAIAAAAGIEALHTIRRKLHLKWSALLVVAALVILIRTPAWVATMPASRRPNAVQSLAMAGGAALSIVVLSWAGVRRSRLARTGLLLLLAGELILSGTWVELEPTGENPTQPVIDYLNADPNWYRVDVDSKARGLLSPPVLISNGFEVPQGSGNPMELFSYTQFYWAVPYKGAPVYQLLGSKYIVVPKDAPPGGEGIWPVFTESPLVDVHLNTNALPRVWLVYDTLPVSTIEEANAVIFAADFSPALVATVENGPDLNGSGSGTLEVLAYGANRAEFLVRTSEKALLVLSDILYPGWTATIDGQPTDLLKTDGIFRGVVVPPGEHRVAMKYAPTSMHLGLGLAGMAILILGYAVWQHRGRRPRLWYNGGDDSSAQNP